MTGILACSSCAPPVSNPAPQSNARWTIAARSVDPSDFPRVRLLLSIDSADGKGSPPFTQAECQVVEDSVAQTVDKFASLRAEPVTAVLVFDRSGSMEGEKIAKAKAAAVGFVRRMSDLDSTEVIAIDDVVDTVAAMTSDRGALERAIDTMDAGGQTAFFDGVRMAVAECAKVKSSRAVIAMTDGRDNKSRYTLGGVISEARKAGVRVFTIGLGDDVRAEELSRLAKETGGQAYLAPTADELAAMHVAISDQLHHEYLVEYESRGVWDGRERRIQVLLGQGESLAQATFSYNPGGVIPVTPLSSGYVSQRTRRLWLAERLQVFGTLTLCLAAALALPKLVSGARRHAHVAWFRRHCLATLGPESSLIGRLCANEQNRDVAFRAGETIVRCPSCGALHHLDCWTFNDFRCYNSPPCKGKGPPLT